ncbi:MAG: peptide deformylase [Candidatus Zixiibacteriota bacterium]
MIREILTLGHPVLWQKSVSVEDVGSAAIQTLIADLSDTLTNFRNMRGFGRGIAAPQIGELSRVIYIRMPDGSFDEPLVNPEIVSAEGAPVELWDDCFSLPGLKVKVTRSSKIRVTYRDSEGKTCDIEASGALAELLQHEIDHLEGILATDRAASRQDIMSIAEWERRNRESDDI